MLNSADVTDIFDLTDAITIAEQAYKEQGNQSVVAVPRKALVSEMTHVSMAGGALDLSEVVAMRMSVGTHNGQVHDAALLFDTRTGKLLSVMDYEFSALRTAGMVGIATKALSLPSSSILSMIGTGRRAADYLRVACMVRPIAEIRLFSRDATKRTQFAKAMESELGISIISASSLDAATRGAHIIYVSTNSRTPVLTAASLDAGLSQGLFVASMGRVPELDESVYLSAGDVFVSDKARVLRRDGGDDAADCQLCRLLDSSQIASDDVHELGEALSDAITPASMVGGITAFKDFPGGSGFGDAALSFAAYRRCVELGKGTFYEMHPDADL